MKRLLNSLEHILTILKRREKKHVYNIIILSFA